MLKTCVRDVAAGRRFLLCRTGEKYTMLKIERSTPGGTQYFVRNDDTKSTGTLNHACYVDLL